MYTQMRLVRVHLPLPSKNLRERRLCSGYFWKVWSVRRRMSNILAYLRVALAATDLQKLEYRQLMRSTCRIETMGLPETMKQAEQWYINHAKQFADLCVNSYI